MKHRIILRADGNNLIGFGHIYRLLALADILKEEFYLIFVLYQSTDFIEKEIRKYCDEIILLPGHLPFKTSDEITPADEIDFDMADVIKADETVVLDGYYFGTKYQQAVKQQHCRLVCIDDMASNYFFADAVINHAPGIEEAIYKKGPSTKLYTGLEYAILRKPFFKPFSSRNKSNNNVFISLGGADYLQITTKLVGHLQQLKEFNSLHIMCSSSFPAAMMDELLQMSKQSAKIKLYQNLAATEIVELMDSCQYAFVSASTVLLEAYARGLTCFAGFYTNNQLFIYNGFIKENSAIGLGNFKDLNAMIIQQSLSQINQVQANKNVMSSKHNLQHIFKQYNLVVS